MFKELLQRDGYQKLELLTQAVGLDVAATAYIVELDPSLISQILLSGEVPKNLPPAEYEIVNSRLYTMSIIMAHFAKLADYNKAELQNIWEEQGAYQKAVVPPPWDALGARDYFRQEKIKGLENSLDWLRNY